MILSLLKAFFVGCIPVIGLGHVNAFLLADHHERPEFVDFDHLRCIRQTLKPNLVQIVRIRTKKFPWGDGDKSLFHNKKLNALPGGYETFGEDEEELEEEEDYQVGDEEDGDVDEPDEEREEKQLDVSEDVADVQGGDEEDEEKEDCQDAEDEIDGNEEDGAAEVGEKEEAGREEILKVDVSKETKISEDGVNQDKEFE